MLDMLDDLLPDDKPQPGLLDDLLEEPKKPKTIGLLDDLLDEPKKPRTNYVDATVYRPDKFREGLALEVAETGKDMGHGFLEKESLFYGQPTRVREDGAIWDGAKWVDPVTREDAGATPKSKVVTPKLPVRGLIKQKIKTDSTLGVPGQAARSVDADITRGVWDETKEAAKAYLALSPAQKLKKHGEMALASQKMLIQEPARALIGATSAAAGLPNYFMSPDKAKEYTEWMQNNTGLMAGDPFVEQDVEQYADDPVMRLLSKGGRTVTGVAPAMAIGAMAPEALPAYMGGEALGNFGAEAGAKKLGVGARTIGGLASGALGYMQGKMPMGQTAEVVLTKGGKLGPVANRVISDTAHAADNAFWQMLNNSTARFTGLDPNRDITEGLGQAALMGAGFREVQGKFGKGRVDVPEPESYKITDTGVEGPRVFQHNQGVTVPKKASDLDQAFYQRQGGSLADLMAMHNAAKGDWSNIDPKAKADAYRWFEINDALQDHPDSTQLRAELGGIKPEGDTAKAITLLQWVKREHENAVNMAAVERGQEPPESRPYYLPRRAQMEPGQGGSPQLATTANATKPRTMMAKIGPDGERVVINADDVSPGGNERLGQATRAEIEAQTDLRYGQDPFLETLNSTAQARSAQRTANLANQVKKNFGGKVGEDGSVPEGYTQFKPDHPAFSLVGDTPIRQDAAKVVDFYTKPKRDGSGLVDQVAGAAESLRYDVTNIAFLNPLVHTPNQLTHFIKALGAQRALHASTMSDDLAESTMKIGQFDPEYQQFLQSGGAAMRRQAHTEQTRKVLNQILEDPRLQKIMDEAQGRQESGLLPKAVKELVNGPVWLLDDAMRFSIWRANRAKGLSPEEASKATDDAFPSYRNPVLMGDETTPEGKTSKGKQLGNAAYNTLFNMERGGPVGRIFAPMFMKFRLGSWMSTVNTLRQAAAPEGIPAKEQLTNPKAWKGRLEAADKAAAVALLAGLIYPALDTAYDKLLGDEAQGIKFKARRGGPLHQLEQVKDVAQGDKTLAQFAQEVAMPNPVVRTMFAAAGYDPYFNRPLPEGSKMATALKSIAPVQDVLQTFDEGKPASMAIAKELMAKRDRSELEQLASRVSAQGMGQMSAESYANYKLKNKLFKAWDAKDTEKAKELETELGDPKTLAKWKKVYGKTPAQVLQEKIQGFDRIQDFTEAVKRANTPEEKVIVRQAILHKMAHAQKLNPIERATLKLMADKLRGKNEPD